jgi:hypothetical protein
MPKKTRRYVTMLEQWKRELSAELGRDVTYEEIAEKTNLSYSTLMKHTNHQFTRPDYGTAAKICEFFNGLSAMGRTPLDYFQEEDEGQPVAVSVA